MHSVWGLSRRGKPYIYIYIYMYILHNTDQAIFLIYIYIYILHNQNIQTNRAEPARKRRSAAGPGRRLKTRGANDPRRIRLSCKIHMKIIYSSVSFLRQTLLVVSTCSCCYFRANAPLGLAPTTFVGLQGGVRVTFMVSRFAGRCPPTAVFYVIVFRYAVFPNLF